jgi:hypothetical protein
MYVCTYNILRLNYLWQQCDQTFCEKSAQFCPNIAQKGALLPQNFAQRNNWSKLGTFKAKNSQNLKVIQLGEFGAIF